MKKLLITLTVMLLLVFALFVMNACGNTAETTATTTETTTEAPVTDAPIPTGYTKYDNGDITFAYPKDWTKQSGSTTVLAGTNGNNITIAYEEKNPYYASMTLSDFNNELKPALESMGLTISNAAVSQTKNAADLAITKISYKATVAGVSMKQTLYITTVGNKTYTVTVTEVQTDETLLKTVFNTLNAAE